MYCILYELSRGGNIALPRFQILSRDGDPLKIGYIRISTADQNTARQEALMQALGVYKGRKPIERANFH
mgnify:CR=1 FL=1